MATKLKKDTEVHITFEDQQMINTFARENNKYVELTDDIKDQEKNLENINEAIEEIMLVDEDIIPIKIGEVFIYSTIDEANELIEDIKVNDEKTNKVYKDKSDGHKKILKDLKVSLYAKFGDSINLESDQ